MKKVVCFVAAALTCLLMSFEALAARAPAQQEMESQSENFQQGLRHYRNRNFSAALEEFRQAEGEVASRAEVLYLIGYCHVMLQQFDDALEAFDEAFLVDPELDPRTIYQNP